MVVCPPDSLVYTQRSAGLNDHAGQVAFPGGKPEAGDGDLMATALRETEEETGMSSAELEVIGRLDGVFTAGYSIAPFVALWRGSRAAAPHPRTAEVDDCFFAPLTVLATPELRSEGLWEAPDGRRWRTTEYALPALHTSLGPQAPKRIWGATGRMTEQLLKLSGLA